MVWAVSLLRMELSPHFLTPVMCAMAFGVWLGLRIGLGPLIYPVLYRQSLNYEASPKAISRRTSYHQVRLAFHP